jgi:hypothetical protein
MTPWLLTLTSAKLISIAALFVLMNTDADATRGVSPAFGWLAILAFLISTVSELLPLTRTAFSADGVGSDELWKWVARVANALGLVSLLAFIFVLAVS